MYCEVCGGKLRKNNTIGVCRRTPACSHERCRRQYAKPDTKAKILESKKSYHIVNRAKRVAYSLEWGRRNIERRQQYREENREQIREYSRNYDKIHPDKHRARQRKRRSLKRSSPHETVNEAILWELYNRMCYICLTPVEYGNWHVDHIFPLSKGGSTLYENLAVVHKSCNMEKGIKIVEDPFASSRHGIAEVARGVVVT